MKARQMLGRGDTLLSWQTTRTRQRQSVRFRESMLLTATAVMLTATGLSGEARAASGNCRAKFTAVPDATPVLPDSMTAQGYSYSNHGYAALEAVADGTAWAVGQTTYQGPTTDPETGETQITQLGSIPLIQRWDGATWTVSPIEEPDRDGRLADIDAVAPGDAWAVGSRENSRWLMAHWNGSTWTRYSPPQSVLVNSLVGPPESWAELALSERFEMTGVDMVAGDEAWAVGNPLDIEQPPRILRWDGLAWLSDLKGEQAARSPSPLDLDPWLSDVAAVAGPSGTEVFVAGRRYDKALGKVRTYVLRRNKDGDWAQMSTPDAPPHQTSTLSALRSIVATSPSDVWAVGTWDSPTGTQQPLVLHYDGQAWTAEQVPAQGHGEFSHVDARAGSGPTTVWASGLQEPGWRGPFGLFAQREATGWRTTTPDNAVGAVAIATPTEGWAVLKARFPEQRIEQLHRVRTC